MRQPVGACEDGMTQTLGRRNWVLTEEDPELYRKISCILETCRGLARKHQLL